MRRIIELCHQNNVKCILSVGGGANSGYKFFASEARSNSFYNQILTFLDVYGFDGIDMDIESTTDKDKYSAMLSKLSGDLKQRNKTLSMAVAPYIIEGLGTNVSYFDYFNVMTYDQNGSGTMNVADYDWTMSQVTCSHYLNQYDFEVGASCSMTLLSQVSTGYPRVPRDSFYLSHIGFLFSIRLRTFLCICHQHSFCFFPDIYCSIFVPVHFISTLASVHSF